MGMMNPSFCVCVTFFLYILFTPTSSCYYFLKTKLEYSAFENLFAEGSHSGAAFPRAMHARLANTARRAKDDSA